MNNAYISALMELAEKDTNVLHFLADSGTGYDELFRKNFPDRIFNFGIGEENMVAAAAGMATTGKIPFVFTAGAFLAYRSMEFIRDDVCFQNLNVKLVGMGCGLSWSSLGPTHHTTEDISVLRAIPNLMILSPATPIQVSECVRKAYAHNGPVYIKIGMNKEKELFETDYSLDLNKNDVIREGTDIVIYATGSIVSKVYEACELLNAAGVSAKLVNVVSLKPFNSEEVLKDAASYNKIFTVEEHSIYGGLGSIVSEVLCYKGNPVKVIPIGINGVFAKGYGSHDDVLSKNGLDAESIYAKIMGEID